MNCNETSHLIPLRDDAGLGAEERRLLEAHLATCGECQQEADALAGPLQALRGMNVPDLESTEVDRIVSAAMPRSSSHWSGWLSHAAAVLVGVSLMAGGRGCQSDTGSLAPDDQVEVADARTLQDPKVSGEAVREVIVEVPVTEYVDRVVEVQMEVRVEVPVEKVVERIVYRDRPVVHALQPRLDAQLRAANLFSQATLAGVQLIDRAYTRIDQRGVPSASGAAPTVGPARPRVIAKALEDPAAPKARYESKRTHLEVRRVGGRVTLRTRGSLLEVVPVLIDTLESEDGAVVAAALDSLQSIHADLGPRAVDLRPEAAPPSRRSGLRALLSSRKAPIRASELDNATLWRDWWTRQRAADGNQRRAAAI